MIKTDRVLILRNRKRDWFHHIHVESNTCRLHVNPNMCTIPDNRPLVDQRWANMSLLQIRYPNVLNVAISDFPTSFCHVAQRWHEFHIAPLPNSVTSEPTLGQSQIPMLDLFVNISNHPYSILCTTTKFCKQTPLIPLA